MKGKEEVRWAVGWWNGGCAVAAAAPASRTWLRGEVLVPRVVLLLAALRERDEMLVKHGAAHLALCDAPLLRLGERPQAKYGKVGEVERQRDALGTRGHHDAVARGHQLIVHKLLDALPQAGGLVHAVD